MVDWCPAQSNNKRDYLQLFEAGDFARICSARLVNSACS
jgi:hypothetical protein